MIFKNIRGIALLLKINVWVALALTIRLIT